MSGEGLANAVSSVDGGISEENRKVFVWVAELLDPARRETALMELSKKREQVPELALVIWHSFGMFSVAIVWVALATETDLSATCRCHDGSTSRDHLCIPIVESFSADGCCVKSSLQCAGALAVRRIPQ